MNYQYTSGLADQGAHEKEHARFLTDGNAIAFAFDSMVRIFESAVKFINHISESLRLGLRKEFLDRLSIVLCFHRICDYKVLGIPNTKARGAVSLFIIREFLL